MSAARRYRHRTWDLRAHIYQECREKFRVPDPGRFVTVIYTTPETVASQVGPVIPLGIIAVGQWKDKRMYVQARGKVVRSNCTRERD